MLFCWLPSVLLLPCLFLGHWPYLPSKVPLSPWEQPLLCQAQKPTASLHYLPLCWTCHLPGVRHTTASLSSSLYHGHYLYLNNAFHFLRCIISWIKTTTSSGQKWWNFFPGVAERWNMWCQTLTPQTRGYSHYQLLFIMRTVPKIRGT